MGLKQRIKQSSRAAKEILRGGFWGHPLVLRNLPFAGYLVLLSLLAIYGAHRAEDNVTHIDELKVTYDELESEYLESLSSLMTLGTESSVKRRVKSLGLIAADKAPIQIINHE